MDDATAGYEGGAGLGRLESIFASGSNYYFGARVFLTASEVAQLKLNADWVVLSACNTIAGDKNFFSRTPARRNLVAHLMSAVRGRPDVEDTVG